MRRAPAGRGVAGAECAAEPHFGFGVAEAPDESDDGVASQGGQLRPLQLLADAFRRLTSDAGTARGIIDDAQSRSTESELLRGLPQFRSVVFGVSNENRVPMSPLSGVQLSTMADALSAGRPSPR
jgi:hypothetical protein